MKTGSEGRTTVSGRQHAPVAVRRVLRLQGRPVPAAHAAAAHRLQGAAAVPAQLTAAACGTAAAHGSV